MKRIIAGLLVVSSLGGCFPVFVPVGPHGYHYDYERGYHRDYQRDWHGRY